MRTNKNYVSIVLDLRRPNVKGNYFVRLRVYSPQSQKTKYYNFDRFKLEQSELEIVYTILEGFKSSEDFAKVMSSIKPRGREREIKSFITKKEVEANDIYNSLDPFNFQDFEFRLLNDLKVSNSFKEFTVNHINHLEKIGNIGNAMNFRTALKSLQYYHTKINKRNELNFIDITPKWLEEYHHFMTSTSGKSETTVSIYLRALRRLFNLAIDEKIIKPENYPFHTQTNKKGYKIPQGNKVKKALTKEDLRKLSEAQPMTPEQEKAKDFWFLSFYTQGMNINDILKLKNENITYINGKQYIQYVRAKTRSTGSKSPKEKKIAVHPEAGRIIEKYSNKLATKNSYLFPILTASDSEFEIKTKTKNFTKFINQHIKKLAAAIDITSGLSTYWARHSFAVNAIKNGATILEISKALHHSDFKVTQNYIESLNSYIEQSKLEEYTDF